MLMGSFMNKFLRHYLYGCKCDNSHYISNVIDETNPKLLKIGNNVRVTHGVVILTHDYSWSVIAGKYGECIGGVAPVTIGDNVFIGMNAIILKGSTIGSNVVIGAGSVVTCDCESKSVYAGVPAKKIMSLEQYYEKKKIAQMSDVQTIVHSIQNEMERRSALREYAAIFEDYRCNAVQKLINDTGYKEVCNRFYEVYSRPFADYYELLKFMETK